jgi:hypothetical protein
VLRCTIAQDEPALWFLKRETALRLEQYRRSYSKPDWEGGFFLLVFTLTPLSQEWSQGFAANLCLGAVEITVQRVLPWVQGARQMSLSTLRACLKRRSWGERSVSTIPAWPMVAICIHSAFCDGFCADSTCCSCSVEETCMFCVHLAREVRVFSVDVPSEMWV